MWCPWSVLLVLTGHVKARLAPSTIITTAESSLSTPFSLLLSFSLSHSLALSLSLVHTLSGCLSRSLHFSSLSLVLPHESQSRQRQTTMERERGCSIDKGRSGPSRGVQSGADRSPRASLTPSHPTPPAHPSPPHTPAQLPQSEGQSLFSAECLGIGRSEHRREVDVHLYGTSARVCFAVAVTVLVCVCMCDCVCVLGDAVDMRHAQTLSFVEYYLILPGLVPNTSFSAASAPSSLSLSLSLALSLSLPVSVSLSLSLPVSLSLSLSHSGLGKLHTGR